METWPNSLYFDDESNFCWGQEADIALFLQLLETRVRKIRTIFEEKLVYYGPKQGNHKQQTLKHRNRQSGSKCTNHK